MYTMPAKHMFKLLDNRNEQGENVDLELITKNHTAARDFALRGLDIEQAPEAMQDAINYIQAQTAIRLTFEQGDKIFKLYPITRAKICSYGVCDTEVAEQILDVMFAFFVGCYAPTFNDGTDTKVMFEHLRDCAAKAGYEVLEWE